MGGNPHDLSRLHYETLKEPANIELAAQATGLTIFSVRHPSDARIRVLCLAGLGHAS